MLADCLASLKATCGTEPQIVVVDNSPSEATRELVGRFANAEYVESPGNPGFAGGNNRAVPFCRREYILLLNNDTVVKSRRSIETLVEFLDSHPDCGVAQGSIVLPNANGLAGGCGSFLTPFGFQYARGFGVPLDTPGVNVPVCCFSVIGAFMMFPRKIRLCRCASVTWRCEDVQGGSGDFRGDIPVAPRDRQSAAQRAPARVGFQDLSAGASFAVPLVSLACRARQPVATTPFRATGRQDMKTATTRHKKTFCLLLDGGLGILHPCFCRRWQNACISAIPLIPDPPIPQ